MIRYERPEEMIAWAAAKLNGRYREDAQAIGVEHNGELLAVAVFDTFSVRDCHLSVVSADSGRFWMTTAFARAVCTYAFHTAQRPRVTCHIPEENLAALRFAARLGARHEGTLREAGPNGSDILVFGMLRRDCRWAPRVLSLGLARR